MYFTDVSQLQHVVQIANQTMEGDLIKQLLLDLLTFGSAFAPLIYDVSPDESCEALINRCKHLWTFVDENPKLREISVCRFTITLMSAEFFCIRNRVTKD